MTPYKLLTLWKIHKEFNPEKFNTDTATAPKSAATSGDIDCAMDALGG